MENVAPKLAFIVPYRDREQQLNFFNRHMKYILEDVKDYKILFIHQKDNRSFNRGALKNIGFLIIKNLYPDDYKNITLVFNDIDTMPFTKNFFDYSTTHGIVKHFFGFTYALGGIVSINASDFENINGFPNLWAWGYEDNLLNNRVTKKKLKIDRSRFFPILDENILQFPHTIKRLVNKHEYDVFKTDTKEGINSINGLQYNINDTMVDVTAFNTGRNEKKEHNKVYDLRSGSKPFISFRNKRNGNMKLLL
jgi:hypothetical protein